MLRFFSFLLIIIGSAFVLPLWAAAPPTADRPLETNPTTKEVKVFGAIYPTRFNSAHGDEARYHLLVWKGGTSPGALIETPADDLAFHDALLTLGAHPGDILTMASWNKRHDPHHSAPKEKVEGHVLEAHLAWEGNSSGIPIHEAFRRSAISNPQSAIEWRFGGNRNRLFNTIPFAPRPGCLVCLYSCPSGKVSNRALSVHEYVATPSRFTANVDLLPPEGTPVIVTFRITQ